MRIKGKEIPIYRLPGKAIKKCLRILVEQYRARMSYHMLKYWNNCKCEEKVIQVAFIVQVPEIWDKEKPIFERMKEDKRFCARLIVVPHYDVSTGMVEKDYQDNYFLTKYPEESILAYDNNTWFRIERGMFDYVFFSRPYDIYLPTKLRSYNVIRKSKCCYVPYGFSGSNVFNEGNTRVDFFRNMYFSFFDTEQMVSEIRKKFTNKEWERHHFMCCGYPALERYLETEVLPSGKDTKVLLWTPRWSYDPIIGGSNFLEYKDVFLTLPELYPKCQFIFRPHPLMFEELVKKNLITVCEVEEYIYKLREAHIEYDSNTPLYEAIAKADVLITDYSSIIVEYYMTGKPIIYCNKGIELNALYSKLVQGAYVVNNVEELIISIAQLIKGEDPLKISRKQMIKDEFAIHKNASGKIVDMILKDCKRYDDQ